MDPLARSLLDAWSAHRQLAPFSQTEPGFDVARAYAVAAALHDERLARGERPVGRKIGFTNRNIWPEYGVYEPIWGFMYDATVQVAGEARASQPIGHLLEPRIEPEIVLHFRQAPPAIGDEAAILASVDWIAHGFEIVQSAFPGWKFKVADTVALNGLHGALVVGPKVPVASIADCARKLREFRIALACDGARRAEGGGANVLGSPLLALAHLVTVLRGLPQFPPVAAGEIVTTGTLTAALLVKPGETWSTALSGIELPGLTLTLE
ncbi:MAG: fumarylacetoacetate hydrolase family protein [Burkholderiales bacterium]|nr:fumarylacetoacetate hydrolase family protein [Burkholderiales bacterium]